MLVAAIRKEKPLLSLHSLYNKKKENYNKYNDNKGFSVICQDVEFQLLLTVD